MTHPLDIAIVVKPDEISEVKEVVERAVVVGSPRLVWQYIKLQRRLGHITTLKIAEAFYLAWTKWTTDDSAGPFKSDDDFLDEASAETGYSKQTIVKYRDVWEYSILRAPQEHIPLLMGKEMNALGLIATASKLGELDKRKWKAAASAPDTVTVREVLGTARTSSSTRLEISIDIKTGQLFRRRGAKSWKAIGMLNIASRDDDDVAAITKIRTNSHIYPR